MKVEISFSKDKRAPLQLNIVATLTTVSLFIILCLMFKMLPTFTAGQAVTPLRPDFISRKTISPPSLDKEIENLKNMHKQKGGVR